MFEKFFQIFKVRDLRKKILFVFGIMIVFRLMANIPVPGIDAAALLKGLQAANNPLKRVFDLTNVLVGGTLEHFSILMLGMGPYITATIVMQLLSMVVPALEELHKEGGEAGRQKINQYSRIIAVFLAAIQGYSMMVLLGKDTILKASPLVQSAALLSIVAGSMIVMWLGELISEKGIGDGVSLLIFAGIVSRLPSSLYLLFQTYSEADIYQIFNLVIFAVASLLIISAVVLVNESRRNISVSYAKHIRGNKVYGGVNTALPISVNPTGVIPIIFALSFLVIPVTIMGMLGRIPGSVGSVFASIASFFNPQTNFWGYNITYFILVFVFTYFYAAVVFNPKEISDNLQKSGGFIPGIRPGDKTSEYIGNVLNRVLFMGALFLSFVALSPSVIGSVTRIQNLDFLVGGTSLLIVVSVVLDTVKKINAQLQMRDYEAI